MLVNYWLLSIATLLLWFPRQWLRTGKSVAGLPAPRRRAREEHDPGDLSLRWREEFTKPRNWIDLLRAMIGGFAVVHICLDTTADAPRVMNHYLLAIKAVVLVVALMIQTMRLEAGRFSLVAPVFFIFGLTFVLAGWVAALFAIIMTWVINRVLASVGAFLCVFFALVLVFGLALSRSSMPLVLLASALAGLPVLLSTVMNRGLERVVKRSNAGRR